MAENLKEKTARGLFWEAVNSGGIQILNLIFGIVLARLLSPADYGMVGILVIFSNIAGTIQDSGFSIALINQKTIEHRDYNAVFWFSMTASVLLYAILYLTAPLIADFFHQPALTKLARFTFLSFIISAMSIPHNAYLAKNMMNKERALIGITALTLSGATGITLAFLGLAYWSLAWQSMIFISVITLGRYYYTVWHPTFHIDLSPIRKMFGFSVNILVTSIAGHINNQLLTFILGRMYAPADVGNFSQANKWKNMAASFLDGTIGQVSQPVFASVADEQERGKRIFRKMARFAAFLAFPVMSGLMMTSTEFVTVLLSDRWRESILPLQILCITGITTPFYTLYQNMAITRGRSDIHMWSFILRTTLQIIFALLAAPYGIIAMIAAYTGINVLWLATWQYFAYKMIHLRISEIISDICPFAAISVIVMLVTYTATMWIENDVILLVGRILLATILYYTSMRLVKAKIFEECIQFISQRLPIKRHK